MEQQVGAGAVQLFALTAVAEGEVRDKDGKLISTTTAEQTINVTREQLREAGMSDEEIDALSKE